LAISAILSNDILQHDEYRGTEQWPPQAAHAAHDRHHHEIAGLAVVQSAGIGEVVQQRVECTCEPHEDAGQREGDPDMPIDVNAVKARTPLIFADRDHGAPERGAQDETHQADRQRKAKHHEIVERVGARQDVDPGDAEIERLARKAAQPVVAK
jgi:hypothetical protein